MNFNNLSDKKYMKIESGKYLIILIFILSGFGLFAQTMKFGHIDVNQVFMTMPEYHNIQKTLDDEISKLELQFTVMREELQKLEDDFMRNMSTYTPLERQTKELEYTEMERKVQEFYLNAQTSMQQRSTELQTPVIERLLKAIEEIGDEEGFIYIFQNSPEVRLTLYYSSQSIDVAPLLMKKLGLK